MTFEEIIKLCQPVLFKAIRREFKTEKLRISKNNYIFVEGKAPILLVAHLDTVHKNRVKDICYSSDNNIIMSPQGIGGDDRCGVFGIMEVWKRSPKKPFLLFTCDEETGGVGAEAFVKDWDKYKLPASLDKIKYIVELDRKGKNDAVYYDCINADFENYIEEYGYKFEWGSFSDISVIAPMLGIAAVNLSSGYYNAHTQHEFIKMDELNATIETVTKMVADIDNAPFFRYMEYIEADYTGLEEYESEDWEEYEKNKIKEELLNYYTDEEIQVYKNAYGEKFLEKLYNEVYY